MIEIKGKLCGKNDLIRWSRCRYEVFDSQPYQLSGQRNRIDKDFKPIENKNVLKCQELWVSQVPEPQMHFHLKAWGHSNNLSHPDGTKRFRLGSLHTARATHLTVRQMRCGACPSVKPLHLV